MRTIIILFLFMNVNSCFSQDIFKIGNYEMQIGETKENFFSKYPEFEIDQNIDESDPAFTEQYISYLGYDDVSIRVKFYKDELYYIYVDDSFFSGVLVDFNPLDYGFIKTSEYTESIDLIYTEVSTDIFEKDNIKISLCVGRFGFLLIERDIELK